MRIQAAHLQRCIVIAGAAFPYPEGRPWEASWQQRVSRWPQGQSCRPSNMSCVPRNAARALLSALCTDATTPDLMVCCPCPLLPCSSSTPAALGPRQPRSSSTACPARCCPLGSPSAIRATPADALVCVSSRSHFDVPDAPPSWFAGWRNSASLCGCRYHFVQVVRFYAHLHAS